MLDRNRRQGLQEFDRFYSRGGCVAHFDPAAKLEIKTDASRMGIGAILLQEDRNSAKKIVSCASRRLTDAEKNYPITELEGLAIVFAVKRFRPYIFGKPVTLYTDHCALCAINNKKDLPRRLSHWALILQEYDLKIKYVKDKHRDVDFLYRAPVALLYEVDGKCVYKCLLIVPIVRDEWREPCEKDDSIRAMMQLHEMGDEEYKLCNGILYTKENKHIVPKSKIDEIIRSHHASELASHPGENSTLNMIKDKYWWPTMVEDVRNYIKRCDVCLRRKTTKIASQGLMESLVSDRTFDNIMLDFIGERKQLKRVTNIY